MNLKEFYTKYKKNIVVLSPVIFGVVFFLASSLIAVLTIRDVEIPENFDKVTTKIDNYEIYQLDPKSNKVKWQIKAKRGESDSDKTQAKIKDAITEVYDGDDVEYRIKSKTANVDDTTKQVNLRDAEVVDAEGKFFLEAKTLKFSDSNSDLIVESGWKLTTTTNQEDYVIAGDRGVIGKSLSKVISNGNASIKKDNLYLNSDKIVIEEEEPIVSTGNVDIKIDKQKTLKANKVVISRNGNIQAVGKVKIKTDKISCFSDFLNIKAGSDGKPRIATMTGSPYIIQDGKNIQADVITYDFLTNKAIAEGNIHTEFL